MVFTNNCQIKTQSPIVTMGTFDGVHLGHQKVIKNLKKKAEKVSGQAVVITYYKHPLEIIHKKTFPYLLTESNQKEKLLKEAGADCVLFLNFTREMATMSPYEFLKKILINKIHMSHIMIGYDTHFGKFRKGNADFLKQYEEEFSYKTEMIPPFTIHNRIISSSMIRDFIREGNILDANRCLGRNYSLMGQVIKGQELGRKIGFPTLNIEPNDAYKLLPAIGVYATIVKIHNSVYKSVTNIGYSPTLKNIHIKEVETHVFDFNKSIYGENVELMFHEKIRDEVLFSSKEELIREIRKDTEKAKKILSE